jgi:hypothetical protein
MIFPPPGPVSPTLYETLETFVEFRGLLCRVILETVEESATGFINLIENVPDPDPTVMPVLPEPASKVPALLQMFAVDEVVLKSARGEVLVSL